MEYDWEDPRLESPIPWDEIIGGSSLSDSYGDNDYIPKVECDDEAKFQPNATSSSREKGKRKVREHNVVDTESRTREYNSSFGDVDGTNVDDVKTSDDEWEFAKKKAYEFRKPKTVRPETTQIEIVQPETVWLEDANIGHAIEGTNETVELNNPVECYSEYENSDEEMDSPVGSDEEDNSLFKNSKTPLEWMIKLTSRS